MLENKKAPCKRNSIAVNAAKPGGERSARFGQGVIVALAELQFESESRVSQDVPTAILSLVRRFAPSLPSRDDEAWLVNLGAAGLVSMVAVKLMLALEAEFDITFADEDLTPENFATLNAIVLLVTRVRASR